MHRIFLTTAAAILSSTAAFAVTDIAAFDSDGDGFASVAEVSATFPGFTASDFRELDGNRDNRLSATELQRPGVHAIVGRYLAGVGGVSPIADIDADRNGFASFGELVLAYPGLTASDFRSIDLNDDRRVSARELYAPAAQTTLSRNRTDGASLTGIAEIDANGDNFVQFGELAAAYPGLSAVDFDVIDGNDDQRVSFTELYRLESQVVLDRSGS